MSRTTQFKTSLWRILWALAGYAPSSTSDIRTRTGLRSDQILTTLKRLERTGIVQRNDGPARMVITWNLTEAGKDVIRDFSAGAYAAFERLDAEDMEGYDDE